VFHSSANSEPKASRLPKPLADKLASWSHNYQESDNPFVVMSRTVTNTVGRIFDETETAKVTRWVRDMDPTFTQESFLRELREYIVPELVDAYVNADQPTLRQWCSEAVRRFLLFVSPPREFLLTPLSPPSQTFNVLVATLQGSIGPSLMSESRVLDIRNLDVRPRPSSSSSSIPALSLTRSLLLYDLQIMSAKILENDIHVFVVSWRTQEVLAYKDLKTGELAVGDENKILQVGYVAVLTRIEEELDNPETGGWKVIDVRLRPPLRPRRRAPADPKLTRSPSLSSLAATDGSSRRLSARPHVRPTAPLASPPRPAPPSAYPPVPATPRRKARVHLSLWPLSRISPSSTSPSYLTLAKQSLYHHSTRPDSARPASPTTPLSSSVSAPLFLTIFSSSSSSIVDEREHDGLKRRSEETRNRTHPALDPALPREQRGCGLLLAHDRTRTSLRCNRALLPTLLVL